MKKILGMLLALIMLFSAFAVLADGNWTCPNCGALNGPSKTECWQCGVVSSSGGSAAPAPAATAAPARAASTVKVGDYVTFGTYSQTSSGTDNTPIEWRVLAVEGNEALLISRYALDAKPFNSSYGNTCWADCTLRSWLNGTFYNYAFSSSDRAAIVTSDNTDTGTEDKVFLLSRSEATDYFKNDSDRRCLPTAYAKKQGVQTAKGVGRIDGQMAVTGWWLRTECKNPRGGSIVYMNGEPDYFNYDCTQRGTSVRPAIRVNISLAGI